MECPYCGRKMEAGALHGIPNDTVYWLPENTGFDFMVLTRKRIEAYGGIILCDTMNAAYAGLLAFWEKGRPVSYACRDCNVILTKV